MHGMLERFSTLCRTILHEPLESRYCTIANDGIKGSTIEFYVIKCAALVVSAQSNVNERLTTRRRRKKWGQL